MNNEPFDLVRGTIRDLDETQNSRDPAIASRAVILIAPFPPAAVSDLSLLGQKNRDLSMGFIGKSLLPARTAALEVGERPWPKMSRHRLAELRAALQQRLDLLVAAIADKFLEKYAGVRFAARLSWWRNRQRFINLALVTIEDQLNAAEQLDPAPEPGFWTSVWQYMQRPRVRWLLIGLAVLVAMIIAIYDS